MIKEIRKGRRELYVVFIERVTYCNCGKIPGSAEAGVIGVIGPGVAGPIDDGAI